jgi:hypothetical protein
MRIYFQSTMTAKCDPVEGNPFSYDNSKPSEVSEDDLLANRKPDSP